GAKCDDGSSADHRFNWNETEVLFSAEEKRLGRSVQDVEFLIRHRTGELDTTRAERLQRTPQDSVAGHGEWCTKPDGRRDRQVIALVRLHGGDHQKATPGELRWRWRANDRWGDYTDPVDGNAIR